ncbi:RHS repeat domain-containing protein [Kribbella sp. NPDC004536]|uniref:RHS repeat domain-containing protein n=1 Tax=Kribbella sp. NPDC004536 TaxID=3364106 RepID=UPI0036D206B4
MTTYSYSGGVYDRREREFRGYSHVTATQHNTAAAGSPAYRSTTTTYRTDSYYTKGLPTQTVTTDAAGHKFTQTDTSYTVRDVNNPGHVVDATDLASTTATLFPFASRTDQSFYEGQATAGKSTYSTADYDDQGNQITALAAGEAGTADDVTTTTGYTSCPTSGVTVANDAKTSVAGVVKRHTHSDVDCATGEVTQTRAYLVDPTTGADSPPATTPTTDATYYPDTDVLRGGQLKTVTGPVNKDGQRATTTYDYDTTVGIYPESVTDQFGYVSTSTHDFRFGVVLTSTDVNHQVVTSAYDNLGRMTSTTAPQEAAAGKTTISFEYHPDATTPYAVAKHADRQADGSYKPDTMDTITFTDGLGRVIQTKADATVATTPGATPADVMTISGHTVFDAFGRAVSTAFPLTEAKGPANTTFNPATDDANVQPTVVTYDVMDRATKTVLPDNTTSSVDYGFGQDRAGDSQFETITTDPNGKTARSYTNVKGQTTAVKQFNPAGGTAQAVIWTSYGYDPLGEKTTITDNTGHVTTTGYDTLGRVTSTISPDSGETDTGYDPAGNMTTQHTAKLAANQVVNYDYDYTRLKAVRYPVFTANNVTYTYGPPGAAHNTASRIAHVADAAGTQDYEYGTLGEVTKDTRDVTNHGSFPGHFTTSYSYDSFNRVLTLTYPDNEVLTYHYNAGGQVDTATGVKTGHTYPYLTGLAYDKFGAPIQQTTGNGTTTTRAFDPITRRLDTLKSQLSSDHGNYVFQNLNYTYDNTGNITKQTNDITAPPGPVVGTQVGGPTTENYRYDDLYRLTHADGTYTPTANKTDHYTLDTTYNALSDITNKNQTRSITNNNVTTPDSGLTYNNTYTYPTAGPTTAQPHAVTTIGNTALAPGGNTSYLYDPAGNQISATAPNGRRQSIWDENNRLECTHENTQSTTLPQTPASCDNAGGTTTSRYLYNPGGERVEKIDANTHLYPNQNYSTTDGKQFKHIYINGAKLLTQQVEADQQTENLQYWDHPDHQGSTSYVTDATGGIAEHINYIPGGETWNDEHPTQPIPTQYTSLEKDTQTGLYYDHARYYDPHTNQFTTTDPALPGIAHDTTSLATYTYAAANPIMNTDPSGLFPTLGPMGASDDTTSASSSGNTAAHGYDPNTGIAFSSNNGLTDTNGNPTIAENGDTTTTSSVAAPAAGAVAAAVAGTAVVKQYYGGTHTWVESYNPVTGETVRVHVRANAEGDPNVVLPFDERLSGWYDEAYAFEVPDVEAMQSGMREALDNGTFGNHSPVDNDCIVFCAEMLQEGEVGGVVSTTSQEAWASIKASGENVSRSVARGGGAAGKTLLVLAIFGAVTAYNESRAEANPRGVALVDAATQFEFGVPYFKVMQTFGGPMVGPGGINPEKMVKAAAGGSSPANFGMACAWGGCR